MFEHGKHTETKEEPTLITDFSPPSGIPRMRSCSEFWPLIWQSSAERRKRTAVQEAPPENQRFNPSDLSQNPDIHRVHILAHFDVFVVAV